MDRFELARAILCMESTNAMREVSICYPALTFVVPIYAPSSGDRFYSVPAASAQGRAVVIRPVACINRHSSTARAPIRSSMPRRGEGRLFPSKPHSFVCWNSLTPKRSTPSVWVRSTLHTLYLRFLSYLTPWCDSGHMATSIPFHVPHQRDAVILRPSP